MSNYSRSLIRTIVPLIVGSAVGWLTTHGVTVDAATILPLVDSIAAAGYYAAVRALEHRWPALGWMLGAPGAPSYGPGNSAPSAPVFTADPVGTGSVPAAMMPAENA